MNCGVNLVLRRPLGLISLRLSISGLKCLTQSEPHPICPASFGLMRRLLPIDVGYFDRIRIIPFIPEFPAYVFSTDVPFQKAHKSGHASFPIAYRFSP